MNVGRGKGQVWGGACMMSKRGERVDGVVVSIPLKAQTSEKWKE